MKILLYVLLAFGVFCFFSCKRIEKEQLTFLMKEWTRKEILFHDRAVLCWETIYTIHWIHDTGEFIAAEFIGKTEGDDTLYFVNLPSTVLLYAREEKSADSPMVNW